LAQKSDIEWTDATWNPVTGCTKVGPGCDNCYAERFAERWRGIAGHPYEQGFDLTLWPSRLKQPVLWKKPRMIFVNSMSDLFHKDIDRTFIDAVFDAMEQADWHVYQVLTKRSSLMRNYVRERYDGGPVPLHIWLGVSVEDAAHTSRIEHLKQINSDARFISFEPLLGPIGDVDLHGASFVTSATVTMWRSSSSNGAVRDRSRAGVCSMVKSGMAFRGRLFPNPSSVPCNPRMLDATSDRKLSGA
jgi:protein gp37